MPCSMPRIKLPLKPPETPMTSPGPLFDANEAAKQRDDGMARVWNNATDWQLAALRAVHACACEHETFIVDRVWEYLDGEPPHDLRAMGMPMRIAAREGWIEATEAYRPSSRKSAHCNPRRVWRSLLKENEGG